MKKRIVSIFLAVAMCICTSMVYALDEPTDSVENQISALIASVDYENLKLLATEDAVDDSVPNSIRENVVSYAAYVPDNPTVTTYGVQTDVEVESHSTIQTVGEINYPDGKVGTMYVSVASAEVKEDEGFNSNLGVRAWVILYWIDNFGPDNEMCAARAEWDFSKCNYEVSDQDFRYGVTDVTGLFWSDDSQWLLLPPRTSVYEEECDYRGLTFKVWTQLKIGSLPNGKLTCWTLNRIVT